MKKYIILHLSLILLVFIACTDDQKQDDKNITFQRSDFKVRKSLSGKTIEFDSLILRPSQIQLFDSFLVTCNQGAEKQFHIFNLNTAHKEGECIPVGQGPKEMMTPCFVNRNDSVVIFDMMTSTIFTYSIPEFTSGKEPEYASRISLDTKPLWSNIRSLGNGFLGVSYQETSPGFLFDQTGKKTMDFGTYPKTEQEYTPAELINASPQTYRDAFYSPVNVGNSLFVLYNGKMVTEPNYNILCKELFVIGWDGSLECHYTLDQGVSSIAVDNQKRKIYGISDDPEYHIVVFDY